MIHNVRNALGCRQIIGYVRLDKIINVPKYSSMNTCREHEGKSQYIISLRT
jgi:hypothetical protein